MQAFCGLLVWRDDDLDLRLLLWRLELLELLLLVVLLGDRLREFLRPEEPELVLLGVSDGRGWAAAASEETDGSCTMGLV